MNRLVIIGNGFDLAHGIPTSYEDFINWYWENRVRDLCFTHSLISEDSLCKIENLREPWNCFAFAQGLNLRPQGVDFIHQMQNNDGMKFSYSTLFSRILKSIEDKRWVDIEQEFYQILTSSDSDEVEKLNAELTFIKNKLTEYLISLPTLDTRNDIISNQLRSPILFQDVAVASQEMWKEFLRSRLCLVGSDDDFDEPTREYSSILSDYFDEETVKKKMRILKQYVSEEYQTLQYAGIEMINYDSVHNDLLIPDRTMLLSFNYTDTEKQYLPENHCYGYFANHIHGSIDKPDTVIFGYGDELDKDYQRMVDMNENKYLRNIKSIRYLESSKYRDLLTFIESSPFQVCIMGHSCGNSDRTLLNTIFEHHNCASIKPYYYRKVDGTDNYVELIQNISRNFTDMKLMRDRVVNKEFCEPLGCHKNCHENGSCHDD